MRTHYQTIVEQHNLHFELLTQPQSNPDSMHDQKSGETVQQVAKTPDIAQLVQSRGHFAHSHTHSLSICETHTGLMGLACNTEFVWSPSTHQWVAHKHLAFQRTMIELLMIRNTMWEYETAPWLPNELMFEIFRALFDVYQYHQRYQARRDQ